MTKSYTHARRVVSLISALALLITCGIAGLVLPASASDVDLLFNGGGTFETDMDFSGTAFPEFENSGTIVADPVVGGTRGNVIKIEPGFSQYVNLKKLYNTSSESFDLSMTAGKSYTLTMDVYGDFVGVYFQGEYNVTEHNAVADQGSSGWFKFGDATEWKTYKIVFTPGEDIATNYRADWWLWGLQFAKNGNGYGGNTGSTYIDNIKLVETPPETPVTYKKLELDEFTAADGGNDMTVHTDTDGTEYLTIDVANSTWKAVNTPAFPKLQRGDKIGIRFKARVATESARICLQTNGGLTDGYNQPEFYVRASANGGEWVSYTTYVTVRSNTTSAYYSFGMHTDSTTGGTGYDIADVEFFRVEGDYNLAGAGDMESGAPEVILGYDVNGLTGATVVADPKDADNMVLSVPNGASSYPRPSYVTWYDDTNARKGTTLKGNTYYRITYRQLGATQMKDGNSLYAEVLSQTGAPGTASTDWKTIVTYIKTKESPNASCGLYFKALADNTYIDDLEIIELAAAPVTAVALDQTTLSLAPNGEETLTATLTETTGVYESITWSSDNAAVTVDQTGKVTAVADGSANITVSVKVDDNTTLTATCAVTVATPVDPDDLLHGLGAFNASDYSGTALSALKGNGTLVSNPSGTGQVLKLECATGSSNVSYGKWNKLWDSATETYSKSLEEGKTYRLTFDMYGAPIAVYWNNTTIIGTSAVATNGSWGEFTADASTWTSQEIYFTVKSNMDLEWDTSFDKGSSNNPWKDVTANGDTYLDNIVVEEVTAGDNLIFNGDFDYGFSGWSKNVTGTSIAADGGEDGSPALKMETAVDASDPASSIVDLWYKSAFNGLLKPNTEYVFSFNYKNAGQGFGQLDVVDPTTWTNWVDTSLTATGWTPVSIEFTTGSSITTNAGYEWQLRRIEWDTQPGEGYTLFDNISLVEKVAAETPVTGVTLSEDALALEVGDEEPLTYTLTPDNGTYESVTWSSDNAAVTVDQTGKVTAAAVGSANITVTVQVDASTQVTDVCAVTVTEPAPSDNLLTNGDFESGDTGWNKSGNGTGTGYTSSAQILEGVGKDGSWGLKVTTSIDLTQYTGGGLWPGAYYGSAFNSTLEKNTAYIFSFDYKNEGVGFSQIQVGTTGASDWSGWGTKTLPAASDWTSYTIEFNTGSLDAATDEGWEWYMRHVQYSTVDGEGAVYFDNFKLVKKPIVPVTGVTLNKEAISLKPTDTETLTYTLDPVNGTYESVSFTSNNTAVATVDSATGLVTAVADGTATITVTVQVDASTQVTDTCAVSVETPAPIDPDDLLHGLGSFSANDYSGTPFSAFLSNNNITIAPNPDGTGTVMKVDTDTEAYGKWNKVWNADTETYSASLKAGSLYRVTFDVYGDKAALYWNGVTFYARRNTSTDGQWTEVGGANEWTTYEFIFKVNGNFNAEWHQSIAKGRGAYSSSTANGATYFDNFVVKEIKEGDEMFFNGDFDYGSAGWGVTTGATVEADKGKDGAGLAITAEGADAVVGVWRKSTFNEMLKKNTTYIFSFDYKHEGAGYGQLDVVNPATWTNWVDTSLTATEWTPVSIEFTTGDTIPTDNGWEWQLRQINEAAGGTGTTYFDNFSLTEKVIPPAPADSVTLNKETLELLSNGSATLTYEITPVNPIYESITWESSDEEVVTVDQEGNVTAVAGGTATITIKVKVDASTTLTDTCAVTITQIVPATDFQIKQESLHLAPSTDSDRINAYETLELVPTPYNGYVDGVTWTSDNETVATVDENGLVTSHAAGTATIKASWNSIERTVVVTVDDFGERITGGDFEGTDWNVKSFWTNHIIKDGVATLVTDPADETNTALAIPAGTSSAKWYWPAHVDPGKTYKITFKAKNADGQAVLYFQDDYVSSGGGWKYKTVETDTWTEVSYIFTTVSEGLNPNYTFGFANLKASTLYIDDVSMVELPEATSFKIIPDQDTLELLPNGTTQLTLRTDPIEASTGVVTWTSSDPSVVTVDQKGNVTAVSNEGSAVITVQNDKGISDSITIVVSEYGELIDNGDFEKETLNWPSHANVQAGVGKDGSYGLVLTNPQEQKVDTFYKGNINVYPGTTYIIEWDYLATTDAEFRLWAGQLGLTLYAKAGNGTEWQHGSKVFTTPADMPDVNSSTMKGWIFAVVSDVEGVAPAVVDNISLKMYNSGVQAESIKLNKTTMTLLPGRTESLGITATPTDGDVNLAVWTSSNEDVATVEYGIVTAVGKGTTTITATTKDGRLSASCVVTVSGDPALITNGTFENSADTTWTIPGASKVEAGSGVNQSNALVIAAGDSVTYTVKNLKAKSSYEFFLRYRSANGSKLGVTMVNGTTDYLASGDPLTAKTLTTGSSWEKKTLEFKTGETVEEDTVLTLSVAEGEGPIYLDHVFLSQKATLVDLVVDSLVTTASEQVTPGTEIQFAVSISNIGVDQIDMGNAVDIDICIDSQPIQTIHYEFDSTFAGGASVLVVGTEKWAAVEGDHVISARVNSTLSILESNVDNNNTVQTDLRVSNDILTPPEIAEQAGFTTLGFSDDFNSLHTIDQGVTGADGYKWYVTRPYGTDPLNPDDYSIEDGILTLKNVDHTYNMGLSSTDYRNGIGFQWNKGYIETRIRIPRPRENTADEGGIPAIWSLPLEKLQGVAPTQWVEMDWMEYWGITESRPGGHYTITLHDQATDENDQQVHYNVSSNPHLEGLGDGEWHTMAWLWAENIVIGYLDGEEIFRLTYSDDNFSDPMPSVRNPGTTGGIGAFSYMNEQELVMHIGGSEDNPMEMDYIRIWTGVDNGSFNPDNGGGDDDDSNGGSGITPDSFWLNYGTDAYGDAITEVTYDNYQSVLDGEELWNAMTDDAKAEINKLFTDNGQPTFDELLAAAKAMKEKVDSGWTPVDWDAINAQAEDFVWYYLSDVDGNPITEVTEDNYEYILDSVAEWDTLDDLVKQAIEDLLKENGQPTYAELVKAAMAVALENGWTEDELPDFDFGDDETDTDTDTPETDDPETDEPVTDDPETDTPETDTPETDAPETDTPETDDSVGGDESEGGEAEGDEPEAEDPSETGATSALPVVLAMVMMLAGAALVFARKRETE